MNEIANVAQEILCAAKALAAQNGVAGMNVRAVAAKCGIAVGTVYNHYPDKGTLIAAVVEDFWRGAFSTIDRDALAALPPVEAIEAFYSQLTGYLTTFQVDWLEQLSLLGAAEKQTGRAWEKKMLGRIVSFLEGILSSSAGVLRAYTKPEREKLAQVIFDCLFAMLRRGETDFSFARALLQKILPA